jgi:type I restriction enzyme S subunit
VSWQFVYLKDICDIKTGRKDANHGENGGPYPFYTCALKPIKSPTKSFDAPAIILPGNGANVGKVLYCNEPFEAYQRTYILNDFRNIDFDFLKFYFKYRWVRHVQTDQYGSATNYLRMRNFDEFQVPLPPLSEQKRIAAILDMADALREKRRQAIAKLDELLQSVFFDMFGDPMTNPMGWDKVKFGEIIEILTDYHANGSYKILKKHVELLNIPDFALMVRTTDLASNNFIDGVKYITKDAYDFLTKSKVFGEEIIINKIGSAGDVYYMPLLNRPVSLGMNQFLIRTTDQALIRYVYQYLKTQCGDSLIKSKVQGAVTKTITKNAVRDVDIILPPLTQQHEFIEKLTFISKLLEHNKRHLNELETLFASLQQRAFKGDL